MQLAAALATGLIALLHLWILVLEMFLWDTPRGRKAFGVSPTFAASTKALAANQGLYNGFLAVGLAAGLFPGPHAFAARVFFLSCVTVAGVYGALTSTWKILFVQGIPGALALALVLAAGA